MRVGFFGQSGPYAPVALLQLLGVDGPFELVVVVEGRKKSVRRAPHRLLDAKRAFGHGHLRLWTNARVYTAKPKID